MDLSDSGAWSPSMMVTSATVHDPVAGRTCPCEHGDRDSPRSSAAQSCVLICRLLPSPSMALESFSFPIPREEADGMRWSGLLHGRLEWSKMRSALWAGAMAVLRL